MKKYIKKLFAIILPLVIIIYPLDLFISTNLKNNNNWYAGEFQVWEDILHKRISSDIFIYGSSRASEHIDPNIIEKQTNKTVFNFGATGQKFDIQSIRNKMIEENLPKPEYIIYSLDVLMFGKSDGPFMKEQFYPYMLCNNELRRELDPYPNAFSKYDFYIPLLRYRGIEGFNAIYRAFKTSLNPNEESIRNKGYLPSDKKWDGVMDHMKKKGIFIEIDPNPESVQNFEAFISKCSKKGVKVIFVYTPQYYEANDIYIGEEKVMTLFDEWSKKYDIPYFNYSADSICYNKEHFYNSMHLNKEGSQLFSEKFAKDLSQYLDSVKSND